MNSIRRPGLLRAARIFLALFTLQTMLATGPAWAQVTAAPSAPAGQKPLIDAAANGVPRVGISAGDLSISGGTLQSGASLSLDSSGRLDVAGTSLNVNTTATLTGREISADGARFTAPGDISLRATATVSAQQAQLASTGSIELTGARIVADGASVSAQRQLDIRAGDDATLRGAQALAGHRCGCPGRRSLGRGFDCRRGRGGCAEGDRSGGG